MRKIIYQVASSLDGFLSGPNGEIDWITDDPDMDLSGMFQRFDTLLIGRHTFDTMVRQGQTTLADARSVVISSTLRPELHPDVTVLADLPAVVSALRSEAGKDIWLFGGGQLFRSLLDLGEVDAVELALIPVLLGDGIPLLPPPYTAAALTLTSHRVYPKSGIVTLNFDVKRRTIP